MTTANQGPSHMTDYPDLDASVPASQHQACASGQTNEFWSFAMLALFQDISCNDSIDMSNEGMPGAMVLVA